MLEQSTRILSENLARAMQRRKFLKRAGEAAFLGLASLASGNLITAKAAQGTQPAPKMSPSIQCSPPGPYCSVNGISTDGCKGAGCYQHMSAGQVYQCRVYYQYYQAGCWTTNGWTCCDCECMNNSGQRVATCGCAQLNTAPVPRPDGVTKA